MKNSGLMKSMTMIENHTNHRIRMVMTTGPNQDHQKTMHTEKDADMMPQIEGIGMIAIQAGQIVVIIMTPQIEGIGMIAIQEGQIVVIIIS